MTARPASHSADVLIVGAGISALAAAHFLTSRGHSALVLEEADRAGGAIRTEHRGGFLIEHGPNSILDTSERLRELIRDMDLEGRRQWVSDGAHRRYVVRDGRLRALPMSPPAFLRSGLFSWRAKLRLLREPFIGPSPADADETLADFVVRRLGREFLDYAIDPFVAGTFAGRPEELSVAAAFPRLYDLEQTYGSLIRGSFASRQTAGAAAQAGATGPRGQHQDTGVSSGPGAKLFSFDAGLQVLVDALVAELADTLRLGHRVARLSRITDGYQVDCSTTGGDTTFAARAVLLTIPAHTYDSLEFGFHFPLTQSLLDIDYPPVSVVHFGFGSTPSACVKLDGFGFLVPSRERRQILGTIWNSATFPGRAPAGGLALTTFVGGSRQPEHAAWPDDRLRQVVAAELKDLMGLEGAPDEVFVRRWQRAIPQYRLGHHDFVQQLEAFEAAHPGLFLGGNFRGGISVADCVTQAHAFSERVSERLAASN